MNAPAKVSLTDITQGQLDAYNAQDLEAYCSFFTDDIIVADLNGAISTRGLAAFHAKYEGVFAQFPKNKVELLNRIVLGATVVDHELVIRAPGGDRFEVGAVYTFAGDKIARIDFVK